MNTSQEAEMRERLQNLDEYISRSRDERKDAKFR